MYTSILVRVARCAAITTAVALGVSSAAAAQTPQPTLSFDRTCYTEDMAAAFSGTGYTAGGVVNFAFAGPQDRRGTATTRADSFGALNGYVTIRSVDDILRREEERQTISVTATDEARAAAGQQPPESQFGATQFTFTRWAGYSPGRYVPGRRVDVELRGWAFAAGGTAWLLFVKGSRTVASAKIGALDGECGDRRARVKVPRNVKPGRYRIVLSTDRRTPSDSYTWRYGRVTRRPAAASASRDAVRSMSRAGDGR